MQEILFGLLAAIVIATVIVSGAIIACWIT